MVGAGSCIGGICRFLLSRAVQLCVSVAFPWGTFAVNIIGCLLIGFFYGLMDRGMHVSENMRLFITVGFCGGFTTFSTFIHESYLLFDSSGHLTLALYTIASLAAGFAAVYLAYSLTRMI